jgi:hypothetical protein
MHDAPHSPAILRLGRRLNAVAIIDPLLHWFGIGIMASALAVLGCRAGFGLEGPPLSFALLPMVVGIVIGLVRGVSRRVPPEAIAAIADARLHAGGRIMEDAHGEDESLAARIGGLRIRWRAGAGVGRALCGGVMLVLAGMAPVSTRAADPGVLHLDRQADALREDVDALEEAEAISELEAEKLEAAIEPLSTPGKRGDAGSRWEALDAASQQVARAAEAGADRLVASIAQSSAVESLAQSGAASTALSPEMAAAMGEALREALKDGALSPELAEAMRKAADSLCSGSGDKANREALERLAEAAGKCSGGASAGLEGLIAKGLASSACMARAGTQATEARLALAKYLQECEGSGTCSKDALLAMLMKCSKPGAGGISRGPGAAALAWDTEAELEGARFNAERVGGQVDPTESITMATMPRLPGADEQGAGSAGGTLGDLEPSSASARSAVVLPRHRDVVRRYFERATPAPSGSK